MFGMRHMNRTQTKAGSIVFGCVDVFVIIVLLAVVLVLFELWTNKTKKKKHSKLYWSSSRFFHNNSILLLYVYLFSFSFFPCSFRIWIESHAHIRTHIFITSPVCIHIFMLDSMHVFAGLEARKKMIVFSILGTRSVLWLASPKPINYYTRMWRRWLVAGLF